MRKLITLAAAAIAACMLATSPAAFAQTVRDAGTGGVISESAYNDLAGDLDAQGEQIATLTSASPDVMGDGVATVDWGDWVGIIIAVWGAALATIVSVAIVRWFGNKLEADDAERLRSFTENAVNMGLNAVANATRGKKLDFKTGSEVVEWAIAYANQNFRGLVEQFGGAESQRSRTWARLDMAEGESIPPIAPKAPAPPAPADRVA